MGAAIEPDGPLREQLQREVRDIERRIAVQCEQAARLRNLAERVEAQVASDERALADLAGVLGQAAQLTTDDLDRRLGGQRLERVALEILARQPSPDAAIHYREWFELIRDEGYEIGGRNPLSTFLSQLNRSEAVERVGQRTGRYRLRLVA